MILLCVFIFSTIFSIFNFIEWSLKDINNDYYYNRQKNGWWFLFYFIIMIMACRDLEHA